MESKDVDTTNGPQPGAIMCVYSQTDEPFYLQLKKSLNLWERQKRVYWLEVLPGEEPIAIWQNDVKRADLILLLLSPDFFADDLCYQTMHTALQERTSRHVPVVPILARAVNWRLSACKNLAIVPHNEQPIASWTSSDEAYASITNDLVRLVPGWLPVPSPARPKVFQARDLPQKYVPRPKVFNEIKRLLLSQYGAQTTAITTALRGAGGFGKTTLALALCHDSEIQAAFPDGILWAELGEQPPRPADLLLRILVSLEPSLGSSLPQLVTLEWARSLWRTTLDGRACLLVIDDVWQAIALEPLLEGGPQCARLITTRNDQVLSQETARVWVDTMEQDEAVEVLRRGLPEEVSPSILGGLAIRLGRWPLLLTLAHGLLLDQVRYGRKVAQALEVVEHVYQQRGVTAFHLEQVHERYQTVERCLEVSLRHLNEFTLSHYQAAKRYLELAIFPEDRDIPIALLRIFWHETAGLEMWETDELCVRLHQLSLLLTCDLGKGTIRLHDVMHNYLVQYADTRLPALRSHFFSTLLDRRTIYIDASIDDTIANSAIAQLLYLQKVDATKDISMYINSPGGSIYAGLAIYDIIQWIKPDVSTVCVNMAYGLGAVLLAAGAKKKRYAFPTSEIMLAPVRAGDENSVANTSITAREILRLRRTLKEILANHTGQSPEKVMLDMDRKLQLNVEEAVSYGIIDAAIPSSFHS